MSPLLLLFLSPATAAPLPQSPTPNAPFLPLPTPTSTTSPTDTSGTSTDSKSRIVLAAPLIFLPIAIFVLLLLWWLMHRQSSKLAHRLGLASAPPPPATPDAPGVVRTASTSSLPVYSKQLGGGEVSVDPADYDTDDEAPRYGAAGEVPSYTEVRYPPSALVRDDGEGRPRSGLLENVPESGESGERVAVTGR